MCGALIWMQFVQYFLFALIAWVSIGVYGSLYILRSLTFQRPRILIEGRDSIHRIDPSEVDRRRAWVALDVIDDGDAAQVISASEVPSSPGQMRLLALSVCGFFGLFSVLFLVGAGWRGSRNYKVRTRLVSLFVRGGPDWTT